MRNLILSLSLAATAFTGTAIAQTATQTMPAAQRPARPMGMDTDRDGVITRAEALAKADAMFAAADSNRDGTVTREERRAARERMRAAAGRPERPDRGVTRADMQARAAARFDRADTNKDGRIDAAEKTAMRAMRHERRGHHGMRSDKGPRMPATAPAAPMTPAGQ